MTPRVLILVLSCHEPPYDAIEAAQKNTWVGTPVDGAAVFRYDCAHPSAMVPKLRGEIRWALFGNLWRLIPQWDFIFRTNSSSYVDKARLVEKAATLPRKRCYAGVDGGGFASGSGFFLSRDCAENLARNLPSIAPAGLVEDEVVGRILAAAGVPITPGERFDYWLPRLHHDGFRSGPTPSDHEAIRRAYHVRCKSDSADRGKDVTAMEHVHRIKTEAP